MVFGVDLQKELLLMSPHIGFSVIF